MKTNLLGRNITYLLDFAQNALHISFLVVTKLIQIMADARDGIIKFYIVKMPSVAINVILGTFKRDYDKDRSN